uniref:SH3 domain-containing protein n=1 Tax=Timema shepardi TaxID=629360 RepID=A0A7R9B8P6_TIMSH|nr:unnamed protein product [Timema shepardi]
MCFIPRSLENNDCVHINTAIALERLVRNHCSKMGEYMLYQALYMYTPVAVGELALKENDILEVPVQQGAPRKGETVLAPPTGWLRAFNTRTGIEGYVRRSLLLGCMWSLFHCVRLVTIANSQTTTIYCILCTDRLIER